MDSQLPNCEHEYDNQDQYTKHLTVMKLKCKKCAQLVYQTSDQDNKSSVIE